MLTLVLTSFLCAAALRKKAGSSVGSSTPNHEKPDQDHRGANALGARMRGHVLPFMLCREHDMELLKRRQLRARARDQKNRGLSYGTPVGSAKQQWQCQLHLKGTAIITVRCRAVCLCIPDTNYPSAIDRGAASFVSRCDTRH